MIFGHGCLHWTPCPMMITCASLGCILYGVRHMMSIYGVQILALQSL